MRSAQRRNKIKKTRTFVISGFVLKLLIPIILVSSFFVYLKLTTKYWDGFNKVSLVYQDPSGNVEVIVLDPVLKEETIMLIPGDTEVSVAHGYGNFRIKNVWKFGENEKIGGRLLAETVTSSFLFPTFLWTDTNINDTKKFIFNPNSTNISFGDRIRIVLFSFNVRSIDRTTIDLGKNQFLRKQTLTDGSQGYIVSGPISTRLTVYFSDNGIGDKNLSFGIIDSTQTPGISNKLGMVLEVLGGKIVSVDKRDIEVDLDCEVYGKNKDAVNKVSDLYNCRKVGTASTLDLEIKIGKKFALRF